MALINYRCTNCRQKLYAEYNSVEVGSSTKCRICNTRFQWSYDHARKLTPVAMCMHPDPASTPWLFCRFCGVFENGKRIAEPTDAELEARLSSFQGAIVDLGLPVLYMYESTVQYTDVPSSEESYSDE